jgi:hypothetical protein
MSLDVSFTHGLGLDFIPLAVSEGRIYFRVDSPAAFSIAGTISGADPDLIRLYQFAWLYDLSTSTTVFFGEQETRGVAGSTLTVGLQEGNAGNRLAGTTSGVLVPGDFYFFEYKAVLHDEEAVSTTPSSGSGSFRFSIVPEPSTLLLLVEGMLWLALASRRKVDDATQRILRDRGAGPGPRISKPPAC